MSNLVNYIKAVYSKFLRKSVSFRYLLTYWFRQKIYRPISYKSEYLNNKKNHLLTKIFKQLDLLLSNTLNEQKRTYYEELKTIIAVRIEDIFFFWRRRKENQHLVEFEEISRKTKNDMKTVALASLVINILSLSMPIMMLQTYDRIIPNRGIPTLSLLTFGVIFLLIFEVTLKILRSHIASMASSVFEHITSCEAIQNLLNANFKEIEDTGSGTFLKRMQAISRLRGFYSGQTLMSIIDLPFTFIYLAVIFHIGHSLAFIPIAIVIIFTITVSIIGKKLKNITKERDVFNDYKTDNLVQILEGVHTVKSLGAELFFIRKNQDLRSKQSKVYFKIAEINNIITNLGSIFSQIMTISVVVYGSILVHEGVMGMGGLAATVMLSGRLMQPIQKALALWTSFQDFYVAQKEVKELFEYNIPDTVELPSDWSFKGDFRVEGIEFKDTIQVIGDGLEAVSKKEIKIVNGVDLNLKIGESIAISSSVGLGKSTLLHILSGFYTPTKGKIYLDDVDISKLPLHQLYRHISYIGEEGEIINGTVKENLTFFGQIPWEEAQIAAEKFGITEAIAVLPQGWETPLHNSPADLLPPGLKQRICIARILAQKPEIIIYDNADVALDNEGYRRLFQVLGKIKSKVILIMVTEDKNFIELADREYTFENGKLNLKKERKDFFAIA